MKILISKHIIQDKIPLMEALGWHITKAKISHTIRKPDWIGVTRFGSTNSHVLGR